MTITRILRLSGCFGVIAATAFAQAIYTDPVGNGRAGADLISLQASDSELSWDFKLQFAPGTLNSANLAFSFVLDTDRLGTPSLFMGIPTTPVFGDDLYLHFNSLKSSEVAVRSRISDLTWTEVGLVSPVWGVDELNISISRSLVGPTSGHANFLLILGVPHTPTGFYVTQQLPALFATELVTAAVPEPAGSSLGFALLAATAVSVRRFARRRT